MMTAPPVQTPATSAKNLQLTSIWEQVLRTRRVPSDVAVTEVVREIRNRLQAGEWEIRQHALRVLADVLSVAGPLTDPLDLQVSLVSNLGSPAPGVRKAAREALAQLLKHHLNPEQALLDVINNFFDENITLGIVVALPDLVRPFILPENGGYVLQNTVLSPILTFLVNKVPIPIYQNACVDTLLKIKDMCGEIKFQKCLADIAPDPRSIHLLTLNLDDSGIDLPLPLKLPSLQIKQSWSDNSDGDEEESVLNTTAPYREFGHRLVGLEEVPSDASDDTFTMEFPSASGRLVLETEIKISEEKAITMRIMEDENVDVNSAGRFVSADGALVMAVIPSSDEEVGRRTPRRVHFGGEVVKLCTPESDASDVRIEIQGTTKEDNPIQRLVIENGVKSSHIPLPVSPATTIPTQHKQRYEIIQRTDAANSMADKKVPSIEIDVVEDIVDVPDIIPSSVPNSSTPVNIGEVSLSSTLQDNSTEERNTENATSIGTCEKPSSSPNSSCENSPTEMVPQSTTDIWVWENLDLLSDSDMASLKNNDNWKEELTCLDQLSRALTNAKIQDKLKTAHSKLLQSLFRFLLERTKLKTADISLSIVSQLLQTLPVESCQPCLPELVPGLCRHVGGIYSVSTKLAAASLMRVLVSRQTSKDVIQVLLGERCLQSTSSKMRENSLLVLMHMLMTYPSTSLPLQHILEETCRRAADSRRRVRHGALEALAVLAQFFSSKEILECASKFGDGQLLEAVSHRLTRRATPSVSPEGLVLYALQISSNRRLGHTGPPQGSDVDWILAGKGSLSTGSARSRGQMQACQSSRWANDNTALPPTPGGNPWTAQKHRNDETHLRTSTTFHDETNYGELFENGSAGGLRPYYLRVNGASEDTQRTQRYAIHRVADAGGAMPIRVLTPSALRKHTESKPSPWIEARNRDTETIELKRMERITGRKPHEPDHHRTMLVGNSPIHHSGTPPAAIFLPSIDSSERFRQPSGRCQETARNEFILTPVEKPRFVEPSVSSKLSEIASTPQSLSQSLPAVTRPLDSATSVRQPLAIIDNNSPFVNVEEKLFRIRGRECNERVALASAPASVIASDRQSSSSSTASLIPSTDVPAEDTEPLEVKSIPYKCLNESYNQKVKAKRKLMGTNGVGKVAPQGVRFPDTLKPFDKPKEGLDTCFSQLNASQWEVMMQGLTSLIRLVRHHPTIVGSHIHALVAALARQIRNLRSQVSRAACAVAAEMFATLKRTLEPELEELAGALFHRVADTNRFIRQDSNEALDALVDNLPPHKTIPVVLLRGGSHPNALVRTAVARLFLRTTERVGPERMLTLPKEIRDKMLVSGASLLTEGRQETRSFAKQLFRLWSTYPGFNNIILEVIPANVMRHISKTLAALRN